MDKAVFVFLKILSVLCSSFISVFAYRLLRAKVHIFCVSVLILTGCTSLSKQQEVSSSAEKQILWSSKQKRLSEIDSWQLNGRLGLIISGRSKGSSMHLNWTQNKDDFLIYLDGPFGIPLAKIRSDGNEVVANISGQEKILKASSAELLMKNLIGWDLPVSSLRFWVMGLPVPRWESKVTLNNDGLPSSIFQKGWDVRYLSYQNEKELSLPARIRIAKDDITLNLMINGWQLGE